MKKLTVIGFILLFVLGGCDLLKPDIAHRNPKGLPDVNAFQDDFSREFMASTKEAEKGYYTFKSKTEKYTMLYPANAKMSKVDYTKAGENTETILYSGDDDVATGDRYSLKAWYTNRENISTETQLNSISTHVGYDGDFAITDFEDKTIYLDYLHDLNSDKKKRTYKLFGTVRSNTSSQNVNFLYTIYCESDQCEYDGDLLEEHVLKLMNSIEFQQED